MDWTDFIQNVAGNYANSAIAAKYQQPYDIAKLRLQALGTDGSLYTEGQAGAVRPGALVIPSSLLLIGGVVLLAVVMSKS